MHSATGLRRSRSAIHVLICLLLILAGAVGASLIQTGGGHIAVQGLKIPGKDGAVASADLFRPDTATATRKAPLIIVTPGFQRTKETQISYSLELARRGYVTLVVDPYNQGESTSQPPHSDDPSIQPAIDYVSRTNTLNYVDKTKIGITGHSAGGSQVRHMAAEYGAKEAKALKKATAPDSPGGTTITKEEREKAEQLNPIRSVLSRAGYSSSTPRSSKTSDPISASATPSTTKAATAIKPTMAICVTPQRPLPSSTLACQSHSTSIMWPSGKATGRLPIEPTAWLIATGRFTRSSRSHPAPSGR